MFNRREQHYFQVLKRLPVWLIVAIAVVIYLGIRYLYFQPTYSAGNPVPPLTGTLANGQNFEPSALDGKYVLIDFWGSWCGPCIADFPELSRLYRQYHDAGFEIVSIAVEKDEKRWKAALNYFSPAWPYQILDRVSNFKFFDGKLTGIFGVRRLPTTFLVGPDGVVIGTNMSWASIDELLSIQLGTRQQN